MGKELQSAVTPNQNPLTAFDDLRTAELHSQFQGSFEYTAGNTRINTNTTVAGGTVTQSSAMAVIGSSTTTASSALLQSKQHARYKSGLGGLLRFTALFTSPAASTEQYIGLLDEVGSDSATGTVTLDSGGSGSVDGITVNSVQIMSGAESFDTDLTKTARNVVTNINANTSAPNYSATSLGVVITIKSDVGGTSVNGFVVTSSTTTIASTDTNMTDGTDGVAFKNGYSIGFTGTAFGIQRWHNNTLTEVAQSAWDDPLDGTGTSGMTLDKTKLNVFFIQFQYLGGGPIRFYIADDKTGDIIKFHTISYVNKNTIPSVDNPNFHFTIWVDNIATSSNIILKSSSYGYFVEGKTSFIELHQPLFSTNIKEKTSVTGEVAIVTIRNKSQYQSKTNFIDIILEHIVASIEASNANNLGSVRLIKNASLGGIPSFSDINTSDSVIDIDTSGTSVTGGEHILSSPLAGKNDKLIELLLPLKIILNPGDTLTFAGKSAGSATINGEMLWKELF